MSAPTRADLQTVVDAVVLEAEAMDAWNAAEGVEACTTSYNAWMGAANAREQVVNAFRNARQAPQGSTSCTSEPRRLPLADGWHGPCSCHRRDGTHAHECTRARPLYGDPTRIDPAAIDQERPA